jgi:hypothetical protein
MFTCCGGSQVEASGEDEVAAANSATVGDARAAEETAGAALAEAAIADTKAAPGEDSKPWVSARTGMEVKPMEVSQSNSKVSIEIPISEGGTKHSRVTAVRTRSKPDVEVELQRALMEAGVEGR